MSRLSVAAKMQIKKLIDQLLAGMVMPSAEEQLINQLPPMKPKTCVAVCIPVAACGGQEEKNLYRTLFLLSRQSMPADYFEVIIFLNRTEGMIPDKTREVAQGISLLMPNLRWIEAEIPREHGGHIGYIRRKLHAVVSERARRAGIDNLTHIILDADTVSMHPGLIVAHLRRLSETGADECIGQLDWDHPDAPTIEIPAFIASERFMLAMLWETGKRLVELASSGMADDMVQVWQVMFGDNFFPIFANAAIRDSAYRSVGGYQPLPILEECDLYRRIWLNRLMRGNFGGICFGTAEQGVVVASSTRRALWALKEMERPIIRQWDFSADMSDAHIRSSIPDMGRYRTREVDEELLERMISLSMKPFVMPRAVLEYAIPRAMAAVGVGADEYEVKFTPVPAEPFLVSAEIAFISGHGLKQWVENRQATALGSK